MEIPDSNPENPPSALPQFDVEKAQAFEQQLLVEQSMPKALAAGIAAALVGAVVWAVVTVLTNYQIGWMAVGIGFLVGWGVRAAGKGVTKTYGYLGAVLSLLGCLLGNVLSIYGFVANELHISIFATINLIPIDGIFEVVKENFSIIDLLFYGIALSQGYKLSFRQISEGEVSTLN